MSLKRLLSYFIKQIFKVEKEITAVEWLVKKFSIELIGDKWDEIADAVQQAKDYERNQLVHAYDDGQMDMANKKSQLGRDYYKEKYGK